MNLTYLRTIHQIIVSGHWITDEVGKSLKEFGISEPQYNVLRVLKQAKGDPVTVNKIAANMVQRNSNVTRIVDKLCNKELVSRKECPANRRKMDISITDSGLELLQMLDAKVEAFHKPMMDKLSQDELATLYHLIRKLKVSS